jgi:hypothetical protein
MTILAGIRQLPHDHVKWRPIDGKMSHMDQYGLCECGCGLPTRLAKQNETERGYAKGEPLRFRRGHHMRLVQSSAYARFKDANGRNVALHRARAERALGRPLPPGVEVHHADGSRRPDAPLVICPDHAYHRAIHARLRVSQAGGNPHTDGFCRTCLKVKPVAQFKMRRAGTVNTLCKACASAAEAARQRAVTASRHAISPLR